MVLRRIQKAIGVRRETVSVYLKAAGIAMRLPRGQSIQAKPASLKDGVITEPTGEPVRVLKRAILRCLWAAEWRISPPNRPFC
jgi:hypothetical protein